MPFKVKIVAAPLEGLWFMWLPGSMGGAGREHKGGFRGAGNVLLNDVGPGALVFHLWKFEIYIYDMYFLFVYYTVIKS